HPRTDTIRTLLFSTRPPPTEIYTLSLHDALPICAVRAAGRAGRRPWTTSCRQRYDRRREDRDVERELDPDAAAAPPRVARAAARSEEHTSELQSRFDLVCRLLLEKKKK